MTWIRRLLSRRRLERELADEIRQHLEEKADELVEGGMPRAAALAVARREFGNVTLAEERGREVWRWALADDFVSDIRYGFRQLRKAPVFAVAGAFTLALGIGANTAVFSIVNSVILRPLPYGQPDRLVSVESRDVRGTPHPAALSYPTFFDFRKDNRAFEHLVSYYDDQITLSGSGEAVQLRGLIVSWDLFPLLGVRPLLGRGFLPHEEAPGERVVILSHGLWNTRFGGDPGIVGQTVSLDREPHTVIGVAPAGFHFPPGSDPVELWTTLARHARSATVQPMTEQRGARLLRAMARLRPGVTLEQAQARMDAVAAALARQYPDTNRSLPGTYVRPELEKLVGDTRKPLLVLLAAVGLVLLIACANVANLLLARTADREREFALRAAIGAGRGRMVRQLVTESLALALAGCAAGVLFAGAILTWVLPLAGNSIPRIQQAAIDGRVLGFSIGLAVCTSVLFSLAPVLRVARGEFSGPLKEGSRGATDRSDGLRSGLVVAQIALGLVLLSSAGLLAASFVHLMRRDLGFRPERLLAFSVSLANAEYPRPRQLEFHARLLEALDSLPDAVSAALAMPLPLTGSSMTVSFNIQERPAPPHERPSSDMAIVSPGYFRTIGVPLLQGREFTERDDDRAPPVLIVNRAFADKFFPGENALGKQIEPGATSDARGTRMREIVGVVGNAKQSPLRPEAEPIYYFPYRQLPWCCPPVVVRTAADPLRIEPAVRSVIASLDKQLPVYEVRTLESILSTGVAVPRFLLFLLGSFAVIALLLTAVGLYGVMAYSVARRTRELGVRIAMGASSREILGMVLKKAMLLVLVGIGIGLGGVLAAGRLVRGMLFVVGAGNPALPAAACCVVALTAALAAYLPARRAASTDPMQALRSE
jgi:putative ABC transport system permease protein